MTKDSCLYWHAKGNTKQIKSISASPVQLQQDQMHSRLPIERNSLPAPSDTSKETNRAVLLWSSLVEFAQMPVACL